MNIDYLPFDESDIGHTQNKQQEIESLITHSNRVAKRAAKYAVASFGPKFATLGYAIGLFHDLGKSLPQWQGAIQYIAQLRTYANNLPEPQKKETLQQAENVKLPYHAAIGGISLYNALKDNTALTRLICHTIAGHHGGLKNANEMEERFKNLSPVEVVLNQRDIDLITNKNGLGSSNIEVMHFIRTLLSILVDADHLASEEHGDCTKGKKRDNWANINWLNAPEIAPSGDGSPAIINGRNIVQNACRQAASLPIGVYSLSSPTGSGKTCAAKIFAQEHAKIHGMERLIYIMPFLSLTQQNAIVLKKMLNCRVLEHTSNDPQDITGDESIERALVSENWDAPIIVSTFVQFFESLFAKTWKKLRKIHNINNSVIIIDEFQALPTELLEVSMQALEILATRHRCTILLMTATQPDMKRDNITQIIDDQTQTMLFQIFKRVEWHWEGEKNWIQLAQQVIQHPRAIVILNTTKDAQVFTSLLRSLYPERKEQIKHLSTMMTYDHRQTVLELCGGKNKQGEKIEGDCILVSTQCIEAGIDISFPVAYRALAPLEAIIQAAGRCNRNGVGNVMGHVHVFRPSEGGRPSEEYHRRTNAAEIYINRMVKAGKDFDDKNEYRKYAKYIRSMAKDAVIHTVEQGQYLFGQVAEEYKLLDEQGIPVFRNIPEVQTILNTVPFGKEQYRKLQKYAINLTGSQSDNTPSVGYVIGHEIYRLIDDYDQLLGVVPINVKKCIIEATMCASGANV